MGRRLHRIHVAVAAFAAASLLGIPGGSFAMAEDAPGASSPDAAPETAEKAAAPDHARDLDASFSQLAAPGDGWQRAESDILRAWSRSGSPALDYLRMRGEKALDEGDAETAIGHLTALTDHAPDHAEGFQLRAAALAMLGQYGPAAGDLVHALRIEPRQFVALTQLGVMLEDMGATDSALAAFRASLAIHPHQQEALDAVARLICTVDGLAL